MRRASSHDLWSEPGQLTFAAAVVAEAAAAAAVGAAVASAAVFAAGDAEVEAPKGKMVSSRHLPAAHEKQLIAAVAFAAAIVAAVQQSS